MPVALNLQTLQICADEELLKSRKLLQALLENSDNDMALNLIAINKLRLSDVWGPS